MSLTMHTCSYILIYENIQYDPAYDVSHYKIDKYNYKMYPLNVQKIMRRRNNKTEK